MQGTERRDAGIECVAANAQEWKDKILDLIHRVASRHRHFSTNEVRAILDKVPGYCGWQLHVHPNMLGACFMISARRGVIEGTKESETAKSTLSNARSVKVWKSLVYWEDQG